MGNNLPKDFFNAQNDLNNIVHLLKKINTFFIYSSATEKVFLFHIKLIKQLVRKKAKIILNEN